MKNTSKAESLLTTSSLTISRKSVCLGLSTILLLTGCSMPSFDDIFGDSRPDQKVEGVRHAPAYNNRTMNAPSPAESITPSPAEANAKLPPMVTSVSPQKVETALDNPYDKYDAAGNEVEVKDTSAGDVNAAQPENKPEDKKWFFSDWFGSDEEAPKETAESTETKSPEKVEPPVVVRKAFIGNPYTPKPLSSNQAPAISPLLTDSDTGQQTKDQGKDTARESMITFVDSAKPEKSAPIIVSGKTSIDTASNVEPVNTTSAEPAREYNSMPSLEAESQQSPASPSSDETLLGRIGSKLDLFELSDRGPDKASADYPEVSSVPQKPDEFDAIKQEQQQNLDELKQDHSAAQKEQELLEREATTPSVPATSNQPASSPAVQSSEPAAEKKVEQPAQPLTMENKKDVAKEEVPPAPDVAAAPSVALQPAPEQPAAASPSLASQNSNVEDNNASKVQESSDEQSPGLFDRLITKISNATKLSGDKPVDDTTSEQAENPAPATSVPVSSLNEVNIEAKPEKKDSEYSGITAAANVAPDPSFQPAEDITGAALPSPEIIKTMRPSRYEARRTTESSSY